MPISPQPSGRWPRWTYNGYGMREAPQAHYLPWRCPSNCASVHLSPPASISAQLLYVKQLKHHLSIATWLLLTLKAIWSAYAHLSRCFFFYYSFLSLRWWITPSPHLKMCSRILLEVIHGELPLTEHPPLGFMIIVVLKLWAKYRTLPHHPHSSLSLIRLNTAIYFQM